MAEGPDPVAAAFAAIDRADFLPPGERGESGFDEPIPIGFGQSNSQPSTVRAMLELLDVLPGQNVLDVGSGSGWTTALLAQLVGPEGSVVGVEIVPELAKTGSANIARYAFDQASIRRAEPGVLGLPGAAPFDRILVSAMAVSLPGELVDQLADNGVMVIPVAGEMLRVTHRRVTAHGYYRFVPLL